MLQGRLLDQSLPAPLVATKAGRPQASPQPLGLGPAPLSNQRRARWKAIEGEGRIQRTRTLLIAILILLATPASASAQHHSHYWHKTHPWVGTTWKQDALCIHHYESSSWQTNTGNGYYGGMQMNADFQAAYGPWMLHHFGTADHWPRNGQLYASYKAWRVRGWTPWPQTRIFCGL